MTCGRIDMEILKTAERGGKTGSFVSKENRYATELNIASQKFDEQTRRPSIRATSLFKFSRTKDNIHESRVGATYWTREGTKLTLCNDQLYDWFAPGL